MKDTPRFLTILGVLGLAVATTACNKPPSTPQAEPSPHSESSAPAPSVPPSTPTAPPGSSTTPSPGNLPPPSNPSGQQGGTN